jgi:transcriptional regulator of acetoin/glycerol metabolism
MTPSAHARKIHAKLEAGAAARSEVAASWYRCLTAHKLQPDREPERVILTQSELARRVESVDEVLHVGQAELTALARRMMTLGGLLSLTDTEGVTLAKWGTGDGLLSAREFGPGMSWNEASQGTNGVGTCLRDGRPVGITLDNHFFFRHAAFICIAAPLFAPQGGIAGTLNVSFANMSLQPMASLLLAVLVSAAQRLESLWFTAAFRDSMIVIDSLAGSLDGSASLAAVTSDLTVVGATHALRAHHGLSQTDLDHGVSAARLLPALAWPASSLADAERQAYARAMRLSNNKVEAAAAELCVSRATMYRKIKEYNLATKRGSSI